MQIFEIEDFFAISDSKLFLLFYFYGYRMKHVDYIIASFVTLLFSIQLLKAQGDVKIGKQVWTSKNLDVSIFRNGDAIPEVKSEGEWIKAGENKKPAWCYYENDSQYGKKYGKLYNWYAVNDSRGLAPNGYHIPSDDEWTTLIDFLGGERNAGPKMKSKAGWKKNFKTSGNGTDASGFNGLPSGYRDKYSMFRGIGNFGYWWSSTEGYTFNAFSRDLSYASFLINKKTPNKEEGFSVRCVRD
jgi:uncharacterized protein (TIGR02145 family)